MNINIAACPNCGRCNRIPASSPGKPRCAQCHRWLTWIAVAGDHDFETVAEDSDIPVLVDFWASWCKPCRLLGPALIRLATERAGALKLVEVDIDVAPLVAKRFAVQSVPTLMLLDHGKMVARQSGAAPVTMLRRWIDDALCNTIETTREKPDQR